MWAIASAAKRAPAGTPDDFMPVWDQAPVEMPDQTPEEIIEVFRSIQRRGRRRRR